MINGPRISFHCKGSGDCPLWRNTSLRSDAWHRVLKTSPYLCRFIKFVVRDMPSVPFTNGEILAAIPQTEEDRVFGIADLEDGLKKGVYEEVTEDFVMEKVKEGLLCSSAFTVWKGEGEERKGRFVLNFHKQSKHWPKGSTKMETVPGFALEMEQGDMMFSFDIKAGYRHFYVHPDMRNFLFHYCGRYFRCVALPFGWGRSPMWCTKMMRGFVRYMREKLGYRVMPYIDDFLVISARVGRVAQESDVTDARIRVTRLIKRLGITRKVGKGCWEGSRKIDHLGVHIDSEKMRVYVSDAKVSRVQDTARKLLRQAHRNRRILPADTIRRSCGVCVSLYLALPLALFFTRSLYFDLAGAERKFRPSRLGLRSWRLLASIVARPPLRTLRSPQPLLQQDGSMGSLFPRQRPPQPAVSARPRVVAWWRGFTRGEGRPLQPVHFSFGMHSDASDVGFGGTLGVDTKAGSPGLGEARVWGKLAVSGLQRTGLSR